MDMPVKKSLKKTTYCQFQKLVGLMEVYPHLATGIPAYGCSRADMEHSWDTVARMVNAIGPPARSGSEWKKIWADLKFRTKKAIADNNKFYELPNGGSSRLRNLTPLELDIDRICRLSAAAAHAGYQNANTTTNTFIIQDVTTQEEQSTSMTESLEICETKPIIITSVQEEYDSTNTMPLQTDQCCETRIDDSVGQESAFQHEHAAETESLLHEKPNRKSVRRPLQNKKKKLCIEKGGNDRTSEQLKLLRKQVDMQSAMLDAMRQQAESSEASAEALQDIAESTKMMAKAMMAVVKHFTGGEVL